MANFDEMGDRLKAMEANADSKFEPHLPIYARVDGRGFSKFTSNMARPFDRRMSACMRAATFALVENTHAKIGYTQADEISIILRADPNGEPMFAGRLQKLVSVLAGITTAAFVRALLHTPGFEFYADQIPHFDARVFQVPDEETAIQALVWREYDAAKNSVSMAAQSVFSHEYLQGMNSQQMREEMTAAGVDYDAYPNHFKRGLWAQRVAYDKIISPDTLTQVPEQHRAKESFSVTRTEVRDMGLSSFAGLTNKTDVVFNGAKPVN